MPRSGLYRPGAQEACSVLPGCFLACPCAFRFRAVVELEVGPVPVLVLVLFGVFAVAGALPLRRFWWYPSGLQPLVVASLVPHLCNRSHRKKKKKTFQRRPCASTHQAPPGDIRQSGAGGSGPVSGSGGRRAFQSSGMLAAMAKGCGCWRMAWLAVLSCPTVFGWSGSASAAGLKGSPLVGSTSRGL